MARAMAPIHTAMMWATPNERAPGDSAGSSGFGPKSLL